LSRNRSFTGSDTFIGAQHHATAITDSMTRLMPKRQSLILGQRREAEAQGR
jgi:hypothetical protein